MVNNEKEGQNEISS